MMKSDFCRFCMKLGKYHNKSIINFKYSGFLSKMTDSQRKERSKL